MARFRPNNPVTTDTPTVEVTIDSDQPLPIGRSRFRLTVTDDSGNESTPADVDVIIRDTQRPTAVLDAPTVVNYGESFTLSGERSTDIGGRIVRYRWELLETADGSRTRQRPPSRGSRVIDDSRLENPEIRRPLEE
ncbi:MAG: hypothetical protein AAGI88_11580 [Pseudomonadota bacterium]